MRLGVTGKRDLSVSAAIHRAVVDVNEEGTEAAAATVIIIGLGAAMEPQLICDHPVRLHACWHCIYRCGHKPLDICTPTTLEQ